MMLMSLITHSSRREKRKKKRRWGEGEKCVGRKENGEKWVGRGKEKET